MPTGDAHAVPVESFTAVCGLEVDELAPFETIDFERASLVRKCQTCQAAVPPSVQD